MTDNAILKKLRWKGQSPVLVVNAPAEFRPVLAALTAEIHTEPAGEYEFILVFARNAAEAAQFVGPAAQCLNGDGLFWASYPKKSSKRYQSDITRDRGWEMLGELGFEPVTQVAIDADWSALRFRRVEYIQKLTRGFALSEQGKRRITGD